MEKGKMKEKRLERCGKCCSYERLASARGRKGQCGNPESVFYLCQVRPGYGGCGKRRVGEWRRGRST